MQAGHAGHKQHCPCTKDEPKCGLACLSNTQLMSRGCRLACRPYYCGSLTAKLASLFCKVFYGPRHPRLILFLTRQVLLLWADCHGMWAPALLRPHHMGRMVQVCDESWSEFRKDWRRQAVLFPQRQTCRHAQGQPSAEKGD